MNLKYFISIIPLFSFFISWGQADTQEAQQREGFQKNKIGSLGIGWLQPFSVGNNFANKGLDVNRGIEFQFNLFLQDTDIFIGYRFQHLNANTSDPLLVGNYDRSSISLHAANLGYYFSIHKKIDFKPSISIGLTRYTNRITGRADKFRDTGVTGILSTAFDYKLNTTISLYISPEYRVDFMNIKTANELDSFFNQAMYIHFNAGIKINF